MVGVHVADEDRTDMLPLQVEHLKRDLGALTAVEEEELPLPPYEGACQETAGKRHHPAGAKGEDFEIHKSGV